jgi:hypothetical protein
MKRATDSICAGLLCVCATFVALAQQPTKTTAAVPRLVKFSGTLTGSGGQPLSGVVGVTFALYEEERGGVPLWMETQNVQADGNGRYTATLGATRNEGIPAEVFASGQGRWLGVQPQQEPERPRVLMASVPYALKAVDAETLGGLPASAFALAGTTNHGPVTELAAGSGKPVQPAAAAQPDQTGSGTTNYITIWTGTTTLGTSKLYQTAAGNVGLGTITPTGKLEAITATATGTGVLGYASSATGATFGVTGKTASSTGTGVLGQATAASGANFGVYGSTASPAGIGVEGNSTTGTGVAGVTSSPAAYGVYGVNTAATGNAFGVYGSSASPTGSAVFGTNVATTGNAYGVNGVSASNGGIGVRGLALAASGTTYGVYGANAATTGTAYGLYGTTASTAGIGALGAATAATGTTYGVYGTTVSPAGISLYGTATSGTGVAGGSSGPSGYGVYGANNATSGNAIGVYGDSSSPAGIGVSANATGGGTALLAIATGGGTAGKFNGPVQINGNLTVTGTVSKGGGSFRIDHPLDPEHKYLYHSFVESPDMMNIYNGVVTLSRRGDAVVTLPDWFEALNRDFRYQLTCIGGFAPVYVASEVSLNQFKIGGGRAGMKISWQVTGIRKDAFANDHRIPVEESKPPIE